jgi:hypothetical protein
MPKDDFYRGLSLAAQIEKLMQHHHAPKNRHISEYEAKILRAAAESLRRAGPATGRTMVSVVAAVFRKLTHAR